MKKKISDKMIIKNYGEEVRELRQEIYRLTSELSLADSVIKGLKAQIRPTEALTIALERGTETQAKILEQVNSFISLLLRRIS